MTDPATPKKRGPKPKPASEQLAQLTIRLPPKLKYGLELLARAQHRSISQAVEWALQVGLNSFEVGFAKEPLGVVVDDAWSQDTEAGRLLEIFRRAPQLLEFEQRAACELVENSTERKRSRHVTDPSPYSQLVVDAEDPKRQAMVARVKEEVALYYRFVSLVWPAVMEAASRLANSGRTISGLVLMDEVLGIDANKSLVSHTKVMEALLSAHPTAVRLGLVEARS